MRPKIKDVMFVKFENLTFHVPCRKNLVPILKIC